MRMLLESWRVLALAVALTALAGENAHAQAPPRGPSAQASDAPRASAPASPKAGAKVGTPARPVAGTGQAPAAKSPAGAPTADAAPMAPFKLSPAEQQLLDETLKHWEDRNSKVKTFKCEFQRREYDMSLDELKASDYMRSIAKGVIKFKPPDQGRFQVTKMHEYDPNVKKDPKAPLLTEVKENLENWVCDGKAIHEFKPDPDGKTGEHLIHVIPEEMRGEAIADGPVPFIFGAKADKLKARYWLRDGTPQAAADKQIWLEVYPKFQHDAANFRYVKVILDSKDYSLFALMIELPSGKQQTTFTFSEIVTNDILQIFKTDFDPPKTPRGWKRTIDPPAEAPTANKPDPQAAGKREAKRDPAPPARR